jgi:hypothetical protein
MCLPIRATDLEEAIYLEIERKDKKEGISETELQKIKTKINGILQPSGNH